jgi:transitional endoplasmic reticulum ATPase
MIARAIASECKATFTAVGISDILNMWVGQSERNLADLFEKARQDKPSVLFFDEIDALAYSRSKANSDHTRTTVNEFLSQLDATSGKNEGLLVLGATNMPWDVDEAMKRPGRFDRQVFVPPPDAAARSAMFRAKLRDVPTGDVDHERLGRATELFSGADVDGVIESAKDAALLRAMDGNARQQLEQQDLLEAAAAATPSTSDWLKTARNLVKFGGAGKAYQDVEKYLRQTGQY